MTYAPPTPADIKSLFPAFANVDDTLIQNWINVAVTQVGPSWIEGDYKWAVELLACHLMVGVGIGAGVEAQMSAQGMASFSMIRSGQLTLQRAATSRNAGDVPSPWNTSWYGMLFYWLLRRSKPPVAVALAPLVFPFDYPFGRGGW